MKHFRFRKKDRVEIWKEIRQRLYAARIESEMTQKEVALTKIVSQSELSKIERGKQTIDLITLAELAALYDEDLTHFLPEDIANLTFKLNREGRYGS